MLISKTAKVKWNSKIKKHYVNLGYEYTKMGDEFEVNVEDLTGGSSSLVICKCDYCGASFERTWIDYHTSRKGYSKDACGNVKCYEQKASESIMAKYGVPVAIMHPDIKAKQKQTNIEKYGCENPFGNQQIKQKIKAYYQTNFGVNSSTQIPTTIEKQKATLMKRYGVDNYSKTSMFRETFRGSGSPVWKGENVKKERTERGTPEYRDWRKEVFGRDRYTCQHCGARNGNGKYIRLEAHHIYDFKNHPELHYDVNNGVTLCVKCHSEFHSLFGKHGNNLDQFKQYQSGKKIC